MAYTLPVSGNVVTKEQHETAINNEFAAFQTAIDGVSLGGRVVGEWDASTGSFPTQRPDASAIQAGDTFVVSAGGTVDGVTFVEGDRLIALVATGGATYSGNWQRAYLTASGQVSYAGAAAPGGPGTTTVDKALDWVVERLTNVHAPPEFYDLPNGSVVLRDALAFLLVENVDERGDRFLNAERRRLREYYSSTSALYPTRISTVTGHVSASAMSKAGSAIVGMYLLNKDPSLLAIANRLADKILALQWRNTGTAREGGIRLSESASQASAFSAGLAGDFLLKLYAITVQPKLIQAAIAIGDFLEVLHDPNSTYQSLYSETPIPELTRNGFTWNGFCDQISSSDVISITCTTWNLVAVPFLQKLAAETGVTSYSTTASEALDFIDTGVNIGYDFFAIYNNSPSSKVGIQWPISTGYDFVADHKWHRQGEETGIGGTDKNTGTAQAGAAGSITLATGASGTNDEYNLSVVVLTGGTGSGQTRAISDYDGGTRVATVSRAWDTPPDATSVYAVRVAANTIGTDQVEYGLTAMLEAGRAIASIKNLYDTYAGYPHIDDGVTAFGSAYNSAYSWPGFFRMRIAGDGGPAGFGSYYDAQGTLIYVKSKVATDDLPEALSLAQSLLNNGALLDENFEPFWSTAGSEVFFTRGTIPVAEAMLGIFKAMDVYS